MTFDREDKLSCVRRELALRKALYPKFIATGRMKQPVADREIALMSAIVEDYENTNTGEPGVAPPLAQ